MPPIPRICSLLPPYYRMCYSAASLLHVFGRNLCADRVPFSLRLGENEAQRGLHPLGEGVRVNVVNVSSLGMTEGELMLLMPAIGPRAVEKRD